MQENHSNLIRRISLLILLCGFSLTARSSYILIPMNITQTNHLKAYGIAYMAINKNIQVDWLLNYEGGSFLIKYHNSIEKECNIRGVLFNVIADVQSTEILRSIVKPEVNQDIVRLNKAPKIAIYSNVFVNKGLGISLERILAALRL